MVGEVADCLVLGWRRSLGGGVSWAVRVALVAGRWVCMLNFDVERVDGLKKSGEGK